MSLLNLFTEALISAAEEVGAYGLHREYQRRIEETSFPRGRILIGQTIRLEARGVAHKVVASWFEQTVDTGPNRCLKYAIWYLAQHYAQVQLRTGDRQRLISLNRVYRYFDGVHLDLGRGFLQDLSVLNPTKIPLTRVYYRRALPLALVIIRHEGVAFGERGDDILMASFLLRMSDVFEGYLRTTLRNEFARRALQLDVLDGNRHGASGGRKPLFDTEPSEDATPDIVIRAPGGSGCHEHPVLVEVKYKPEVTRDDINQAITYGASYRAPVVVLAIPQPADKVGGLRSVGRIGTLSVYEYRFNLAADNIEAEEQAFGSYIQGLC